MATLSTSAWVLHDLGLAAGFGGPLFGRLALTPAVKQIASREERDRVLDVAWRDYNVVDAISLLTMGVTWLAGRSKFSGRAVDRRTRRLVIAKDVLVGSAIATGLVNVVASRVLSHSRQGEAGDARTPRRAAKLLKVMGPINIGLVAGVIGVTAVLGMKAGRSARWAVVSRFLP
jgi:hypothetical protein